MFKGQINLPKPLYNSFGDIAEAILTYEPNVVKVINSPNQSNKPTHSYRGKAIRARINTNATPGNIRCFALLTDFGPTVNLRWYSRVRNGSKHFPPSEHLSVLMVESVLASFC
jgi:hypothetical protein